MPNAESFQTAKKTLPVFFLLPPVINEQQSVLRQQIMEEFEKQLSDLTDAAAKYAILSIGQLTTMQTKELVDSLSAINCSQLLDLDCAFSHLNQALSRKTMLQSIYGVHFPVIIYLGDCFQNLRQYTYHLKDNKWFQRGLQLAVFFSEESRAHFEGFCNLSECCYLCNVVSDSESNVQSAVDFLLRMSNVISVSGYIPSPRFGVWVTDAEGDFVLVDSVDENISATERADDSWDSDWDDWD